MTSHTNRMLWMVNQDKERFYRFEINSETCELVRAWGGLYTMRGGMCKNKFQSLQELNAHFRAIFLKRLRNGYK